MQLRGIGGLRSMCFRNPGCFCAFCVFRFFCVRGASLRPPLPLLFCQPFLLGTLDEAPLLRAGLGLLFFAATLFFFCFQQWGARRSKGFRRQGRRTSYTRRFCIRDPEPLFCIFVTILFFVSLFIFALFLASPPAVLSSFHPIVVSIFHLEMQVS